MNFGIVRLHLNKIGAITIPATHLTKYKRYYLQK